MKASLTWSGPSRSASTLTFTGVAEGGGLAADGLLTWDERSALEHEARVVSDRVRDCVALDALLHGPEARELADYHVLYEVVNVLRGWALGRAWLRTSPQVAGAPVEADDETPTAVVLGVAAALGGLEGAIAWWPVAPVPAARGARLNALRAAASALALRPRPYPVRVLAVPAMNVGRALERTSPEAVRAAGVGVALYPGLEDVAVVRLARRAGIPVVSGGRWPIPSAGRRTPAARIRAALPTLHDDEALDRALKDVAARVLADAQRLAGRARTTLRGWEALPDLRAVVLPTAAAGMARVACTWAHRHGVRVAVVQHGIYGFREGDGGDRRADVILGWGEAVAEQVAEWNGNRARVAVIGAPGVTAGGPDARASSSLRRVLVATTNSPTGSALGLLGFREAFLEDIAPTIARLAAAGVAVEVRPHPAESPDLYRRWIDGLGIAAELGGSPSLQGALERADLVVCSMSSVAFEAAALGIPLVIWTGRTPPDVRREHLLPPIDGAGAGMFDDAGALLALCDGDAGGLLAAGHELGAQLRRFVEPFDAAAFGEQLAKLGQS